MDLPITGEALKWLALPFGILFGVLLQRGGVANYDVIVDQFRLKDFTVLKVMFTAIIVGGIGVLLLHGAGLAAYHIKPSNVLGVLLGAILFGVGMVVYGYCPGTGLVAIATGSVHALVGLAGMLVGGILYALSFPWIQDHLLDIGVWGKVRLPDVSGVPDWIWFVALVGVAGVVFWLIETRAGPVRRTNETGDPS